MTSDQSFVVQFHNVPGFEIDEDMQAFAFKKIIEQTRAGHVDMIDVYPQERKIGGWIEWTLRFHTRDGGTSSWFTLGLIQRGIGAEFESHS